MTMRINIKGDNALLSGAGLTSSLVLGGALSLLAVRWYNKKSEKDLPPMANMGMLEAARALSSPDFPDMLLEVAEDLGSYTFRFPIFLPFVPMVVAVGDYELARSILKDPSTSKHFSYRMFESLTSGPSIISANGMAWEHRRKHINPAFSSQHIQRMIQVVVPDVVDSWIQNKLEPLMKEGGAFDVSSELLHISLEVLCKAAFEYEIKEEERAQFVEDLRICLKEFICKTFSNPFRLLLGPLLQERREAKRAAGRLHALCQKMLDSYKTIGKPIEGTMMDFMLRNSNYKDDNDRVNDMVFYIFAGHDTTAYTMAFTLRELSRPENRGLQSAIRAELRALEESSDQPKKSEMLQQSVKEAMRLYPVTPQGSARTVPKDTAMKRPDGTTVIIPKGSFAMFTHLLLHRHPDVYANPEQFRPSRWQNPSDEEKLSFMPFSEGKRNCAGQHFATASSYAILARLLSTFRFELVEGGCWEFVTTLKPAGARLMARRV